MPGKEALIAKLMLSWTNAWQNNLTSQAATMELNNVPNDIISNLNPISIIIFIPLMDKIIYPALRKAGINFSPIKRIAMGFFLASLAMVSSTVIQYYIYKLHPLGNMPNSAENGEYAPINVWVQSVPYALIGFSEIMASVTGLEYAYTKAPTNMKSIVTSVFLLMNAFSSAIAQALVALSEDPLLEWNYGLVAVLAAIAGVLFWLDNRKLDGQEDSMNMQVTGRFHARASDVEESK